MQKTPTPKTQPDHKNGHKPETAMLTEQPTALGGITELSGGLLGAQGNGNIEKQKVWISDARLQAIQRQTMAAQIGKSHGNQHVQRLIRSLQRATESPSQQNDVGSPSQMAPTAAVNEADVVKQLMAQGESDGNKLTNELYYRRHEEARGDKLERGTPEAREWLDIRNTVVRPALGPAGGTSAATKPKMSEVASGAQEPTGDPLFQEVLKPLKEKLLDTVATQGSTPATTESSDAVTPANSQPQAPTGADQGAGSKVKDTIQVAMQLEKELRKKHPDYGQKGGFQGYGSKEEDQYVCTTFARKVLAEAGYNVSGGIWKRMNIMIDWQKEIGHKKPTKEEENATYQKMIESGDPRAKGIVSALVESKQGTEVSVDQLKEGDFIQYWYTDKQGDLAGHVVQVTKVIPNGGDLTLHVHGSHGSTRGVTTIPLRVRVNGKQPDRIKKIYGVRPMGSQANQVASSSPAGIQNTTKPKLETASAGGAHSQTTQPQEKDGKPVEPATPAISTSERPVISADQEAMMKADTEEIVQLLKSQWMSDADEEKALAKVRKWASQDDEYREKSGYAGTDYLDRFLFFCKTRTYTRRTARSAWVEQWSSVYDDLWHELEDDRLNAFQALVAKSKKQGTKGPETERMENAWSYVGKREAMGSVGILKAMGLAITGVVDTAIWLEWKMYGAPLGEVLKKAGIELPKNAPEISKFVDKSYDESAKLLAQTMGIDMNEELFAGMSSYEFGATAGKVPAALMMAGGLSELGAAGQVIGMAQTAKQAEGLFDSVKKMRASGVSWADIAKKPDVWLQVVGVVGGVIGAAGGFAQAESQLAQTLQKMGAVTNATQVSIMVAAYLAVDDDPKLSAKEKSKRKAELLADMVTTTALMINDRYGKDFQKAWERNFQQGKGVTETSTTQKEVGSEPTTAAEPNLGNETPRRSPANKSTESGAMSLEVHPDLPNVMVDTSVPGLDFEGLMAQLERTPQGSAIADKIRSGELHVTVTGESIIKGWAGAQKGDEIHVRWEGSPEETASTLVHEGAHFIDKPARGQPKASALSEEGIARAFEYEYREKAGLPAYDAAEQAYRDAFRQTMKDTGDVRSARIAADKAMLDAMRANPKRFGVETPAQEASKLESSRKIPKSETPPATFQEPQTDAERRLFGDLFEESASTGAAGTDEEVTQPDILIPEEVTKPGGSGNEGPLSPKAARQLTPKQVERLRVLEEYGLNPNSPKLKKYLKNYKGSLDEAISNLEDYAKNRTSSEDKLSLGEKSPEGRSINLGKEAEFGPKRRAPEEEGFWSGKESIDASKGHALWYSDNPEVNAITNYEPIPFKDGHPDFSAWAKEKAYINQTGENETDFPAADRNLAEQKGWLKKDGTPNASKAEQFRKDNKLTWHHVEDRKTMLLVPTPLHENVPHIGGASASKTEAQQGTATK